LGCSSERVRQVRVSLGLPVNLKAKYAAITDAGVTRRTALAAEARRLNEAEPGLTRKQFATRLGTSDATLRRILDETGVQLKFGRRPHGFWQALDWNKTDADIAAEIGESADFIAKNRSRVALAARQASTPSPLARLPVSPGSTSDV